MQCDNNYLNLISGHLDGCNSEIEEKRLQQHLKTCRHCRELLEIMKDNDALLSQSPEQPPEDLTARIMSAVAREPKKQRNRRRFYISTAAAGLAAAAMLCFAVMGDKLPLLATKSDSAQNEAAHAESYSFEASDPQSDISFIDDIETVPLAEAPEQEPADEPADAPMEVATSGTPDSPPLADAPADVPATTENNPARHTDEPQTSTEDETENNFSGFSLPASISDGLSGGSIADRNVSGDKGVPTLVIWGVQSDTLRLPFSAVKGEFGLRSNSVNKASLYEHFAAALFSLGQPSFIGNNGSKFPTPAYNTELFTLGYEELCELFAACAGKYELAVYFPQTANLEGDCQLILIASPKVSGKNISYATE